MICICLFWDGILQTIDYASSYCLSHLQTSNWVPLVNFNFRRNFCGSYLIHWHLLFSRSSIDYIDALYQLQEWYANDPDPRLSADEEDFLDTYGLSYDCPGFRCVLDYALAAVRGSLAAAMALTRGDCRVSSHFHCTCSLNVRNRLISFIKRLIN